MKLTKSKLKQVIREVLKEASIRGTGDVGRSVYARRKADPQWQPTGEYEADPDKPGEVRPILKKQGGDFRTSDGQLRAGHRSWCRSQALKAFPERVADIGPNKGKDRNKDKREELTQRCFDLVKTAADKGDMDWWGIKSNLGLVEGDSKMKITKSQLTQIIKEELQAVLSEASNCIQDAEKDIEQRGTEGVCTGDKFGSESCPPGSKRYNLAKTFRKMAKDRKKK